MKKFSAILLSLLCVLALFSFTACSENAKQEDTEAAEYTLGLGIVVNTSSATDNKAAADVTAVAVICDKDGKIVDCKVDALAAGMAIENGVAAKGGTYLTKNELGADYGMASVSPIGKEWNEQAEFFADYVKGMQKDSAKIALNKLGKAEDADLLAGCTIGLTDIEKALGLALNDKGAVSFTSEEEAKASLGFAIDDSASVDASAEKDGTASFATSICAVAKSDKAVLASIADTADIAIAFSADGKITSADFGGTKRELGDGYGMKAASGIGKEWDEQAAFFCEFVNGKSFEDIKNIATTAVGKPEDSDLLSGCTMGITGIKAALIKAIEG